MLWFDHYAIGGNGERKREGHLKRLAERGEEWEEGEEEKGEGEGGGKEVREGEGRDEGHPRGYVSNFLVRPASS